MFKKWRITRNLQTVMIHVNKMADLERLRMQYEAKGQRKMVLAVNFEISSHATRGLHAVRQIEELAGSSEAINTDYKRYLIDNVDLPALPRSKVDMTNKTKIQELYSEFNALEPDLMTSREIEARNR